MGGFHEGPEEAFLHPQAGYMTAILSRHETKKLAKPDGAIFDSIEMPRKIRELIQDLNEAGFHEIPGAGKGSHRKFVHADYPGAVTLSGKAGEDAKHYQERQVKRAIESVKP